MREGVKGYLGFLSPPNSRLACLISLCLCVWSLTNWNALLESWSLWKHVQEWPSQSPHLRLSLSPAHVFFSLAKFRISDHHMTISFSASTFLNGFSLSSPPFSYRLFLLQGLFFCWFSLFFIFFYLLLTFLAFSDSTTLLNRYQYYPFSISFLFFYDVLVGFSLGSVFISLGSIFVMFRSVAVSFGESRPCAILFSWSLLMGCWCL